MKKDEELKSDAYWKTRLTPEQFRVLREKGTERPGTGEYYHLKDKGTYLCGACGLELFASDDKYDSGSGWPSFFEELKAGNIEQVVDSSHGMQRTEILCSRCGSHLGHLFDDGPEPTGKRYCVNSLSLKLDRGKK
ncbi:MAG: peptide-methionine (R)-S-oxide reductase MsrB [Deltaproteobacteria bacterium]|nr:peptide-methionine (R)-S-oxide reductase MsrB [Deltaproteobacteria bacterium]